MRCIECVHCKVVEDGYWCVDCCESVGDPHIDFGGGCDGFRSVLNG